MPNQIDNEDCRDVAAYAPGERVLLSDELVGRLQRYKNPRLQWSSPAVVLYTTFSPDISVKNTVMLLTCDGELERWGCLWLKRA